MKWACGVTTVIERLGDGTLPRTLESLENAGFDRGGVFADKSRIGVSSHWLLVLMELYLRHPNAERYAMFQDDILICKGTRAYLEAQPWPERCYLNLYNHPDNEPKSLGRRWYPSLQLGKGAQALVFDRAAAAVVLTSQYMIDRPKNEETGRKNLDGGIASAFREANQKLSEPNKEVVLWRELVHYPSLVQHVGEKSTIEGNVMHKSASFPGEDFDALSLGASP